MQKPFITYQTELSGNVVLLCRFLRSKGFSLSPTEEADALLALTYLPIGQENYFKEGLKTILTKSWYERAKFDDFYGEFWHQLSKAADSKLKEASSRKEKESENQKRNIRFESLKDWLNLNPASDEEVVSSYSDLDVLTKKNFSDLSEEEMQLMMRLLSRLARSIAHQKSRLKKGSKKHRNLDLKRTIRENLRRDGSIQKLYYSERKEKRLKLVLLCDVSKSMDLYSRFFVHLIYAFQNAYDRIETFVFSTALHRVSEILDNNQFDKAFDIISDRVPQWSGGTTIGSCLIQFSEEYGYRLLDRKTIVLILSDGWDTGEVEIMEKAMKDIYKRSRKVVWLNPLAGHPDFSPEAIGMKTALPYIDILGSAHNLESLKRILYQLQRRGNLRNRQHVH
jgi:uncharacterized protein with von Willebrand factor type A (vWA) domain